MDGVPAGVPVLRIEGQSSIVPVVARGRLRWREQTIELSRRTAGGRGIQLIRVQAETRSAMEPGDGAAIVHARHPDARM